MQLGGKSFQQNWCPRCGKLVKKKPHRIQIKADFKNDKSSCVTVHEECLQGSRRKHFFLEKHCIFKCFIRVRGMPLSLKGLVLVIARDRMLIRLSD